MIAARMAPRGAAGAQRCGERPTSDLIETRAQQPVPQDARRDTSPAFSLTPEKKGSSLCSHGAAARACRQRRMLTVSRYEKGQRRTVPA